MCTGDWLDVCRLLGAVLTALVFLAGALVPLFSLLVPYWRVHHRVNWALAARVFLNLSIAAVAVYDGLFSYYRYFLPDVDREFLRVIGLFMFPLMALGKIWSWFTHPDGMRGL